MVAYFKYQTTKKVNEVIGTPSAKVWQRNYFDRIIRSENELDKIRKYIDGNVAHWHDDGENPMNREKQIPP